MPQSPEEESTLDLSDLAYPILAFWLDRDAAGEHRNERFRLFVSAQDLAVVSAWGLRCEHSPGTQFLDNAGRNFQIANVIGGEFVTPLWLRILARVMRDPGSIRRRVEYRVVVLPPMPFADAKARVGASIQRNTDDWLDDEAMAGESGEPLKLEDVIAVAMKAVRKATTVKDLHEGLDAAWPY